MPCDGEEGRGSGGGGVHGSALRLKTEEARHQPPPEQINVKLRRRGGPRLSLHSSGAV